MDSILNPLTEHDELLRYFKDIHFDRVRHLRPLAETGREDALPRARRRIAELPSRDELETWYRTLKTALDRSADDVQSQRLVTLLVQTLRGKQLNELVVGSFVIAIRDSRMSPEIAAGAVKRAWLRFVNKPSVQAFLQLCFDHRAETEAALECDAFSRTWRRLLSWRRGKLRRIKRQFSKRARGAGRFDTKKVAEDR